MIRNFGTSILDQHGVCIAFPHLKTPLWNDLLNLVPGWFQKKGGGGEMCNKVHTHFASIAPTQHRGKDKFLAWLKELVQLVMDPLPVE